MYRYLVLFIMILFLSTSCAKKATISPMEDGGFYVEMSDDMSVEIKEDDYELKASTKDEVPMVEVAETKSIFGSILGLVPFVD